MNNYVPKAGDKVRATLGQSVLVGTVEYVASDVVGIVADGVRRLQPNSMYLVDGWQFEQVVSVPTKFGAVIRRADGIMLSLADPYDTEDVCTWLTAGDGEGRGIGWFSNAEATAGGFTVLFEGVDE